MTAASPAQHLVQAFAHLDDGRPAEARRLARALEKLRPEPPGLAYLLGLLALEEGEGRKAAQHLQRALRLTPQAIPPLLAMARAQTLQRRFVDAERLFHRLLSLDPSLTPAWQELADLALVDGAYAEAFPLLIRASRLSPDLAALRNNLGIAARARGGIDLAEQNFTAAILLDPGLARAYANLAGVKRHLGQSAIGPAARSVQLQPDGATEIEYGQALSDEQDFSGALAAFRRAAQQLPGQIEPLWLQAGLLRHIGDHQTAISLCREILARDPSDRFGATLMLAQLGGERPPDRAPQAHIARLYDQYAESFEDNLLNALDYRAPAVLLDALTSAGLSGPFNVLDAGCGTGLMGQAIRPHSKRLDGIDLSAKMVELARRRGIYDELVVGDLLTEMANRSTLYDLILAADVLIYLGDLTDLIRQAAQLLAPQGAFAFTVERSDGDEVTLTPSGRFAHSKTHLRKVAKAAGLRVFLLENTSTRSESTLPVPGLVCILARS